MKTCVNGQCAIHHGGPDAELHWADAIAVSRDWIEKHIPIVMELCQNGATGDQVTVALMQHIATDCDFGPSTIPIDPKRANMAGALALAVALLAGSVAKDMEAARK